MRDRLAFLHLPKSAGTSYRHAIAQYYNRADIVPWSFDRWSFGNHDTIPDVRQPILLDDDADLSGYRYMEGHFALSTIRRGFAASEVVCIFREPRARLLSHYAFWRSWGPDMREQWMPYDVPRAARQSLGVFCGDRSAAHQADNLITRLVVGPHRLIPADGPIQAEHRAELVDVGRRALDELGFVGILERGESTFDDLEDWFGSSLDRVRLNETDLDGGPPLVADELNDEAAMALLHERTEIDRELWVDAAARTGMSRAEAIELGDATFASSLDRLVERSRRQLPERRPASPSAEAAGQAGADVVAQVGGQSGAGEIGGQSGADLIAEIDAPAAVNATAEPIAAAPAGSMAKRLWVLIRRGPLAVVRRVVYQFRRKR